MQFKTLIGVLFGVWIAFNFELNDAVVFKMTNAVCESYNKSWVVFRNCRLKAVSRNKVIFNACATALHPINDATVRFRVFKRANGYKPWLFDVHIDACRYLRKPYNPAVAIVYGLAKEFTDINHTCPYVGSYTIKNFYLKPELLHLPLPTGDYMLSMQFFMDKKLQFDTNVSFTFEEDLMKRN